MSREVIEQENLNGAGAIALQQGRTLQQVRSSFATAVSVQKARNLPEVKRRLIEEARLMGGDCFYGWRAGGEQIEGPSIDLAVAAARCWGNCATDMLPVQDLPDSWIFTAAFIDLETGYTRTRQFRQSKKSAVHGKLDDERKDDIRFQVGQSKAERNVILKALPSWLINAALDAAKEGVREEMDRLIKTNGIVTVQDRIIAALAKHGAKEKEVLAKCGVAERKGLTIDHLVILRGDLHALQSGQERVEHLFPLVETTAAPPAKSKKTQSQKEPDKQRIGKDTLARMNQLFREFNLAPPEKEDLLAQYRVNSFEELTEEQGQSICAEFAEAIENRKKTAIEQPAREPGVDEEDEGPPMPEDF